MDGLPSLTTRAHRLQFVRRIHHHLRIVIRPLEVVAQPLDLGEARRGREGIGSPAIDAAENAISHPLLRRLREPAPLDRDADAWRSRWPHAGCLDGRTPCAAALVSLRGRDAVGTTGVAGP